jgi:DNA-binding transcriptional LysR family regulator
MDRLTELQVLVAIADAGSLIGAARRLHRSAPAVTRILSGLEARVGTVLVERTPRRCVPTDAGRALVDRARRVLDGYAEAIEETAGAAAAPAGSVRVTAPLVFGRDHVAPAVASFLDLHGGIEVDLMISDRVVDLAEDEVDIAVRIAPLADESLVARRIGSVRRVTVASPAYLARPGPRRSPHRPG